MRGTWWVVACSYVFWCACGPAGGSDAPDAPGGSNTPMLIAGGGVANGPISGTLNVYVVASGGSTPIAGASVTAGTHTATTDATGLATFTDLNGAQTISATASGKAATTWIGANGANVTIPLDPSPRTTPTAKASGSINGWDSLAAPSFGHYTLAVVLYSFVTDVAAPENNLTQPTSNGAPLDTCVNSGLGSSCAWQLTTRTGAQRHVATIVDGDAHGTSSDLSDDTYTLVGYAAGQSVSLTANQQQSNETLSMVPSNQLANLSVSFPAAPSGLGRVIAIPMLDLGADGKVVFPLPTLDAGHTSTKVIAPTGTFAGTYDLVALATPNATAKTPYSTVLMNGVSLSQAAIDPFLAAPSALSAANGTYKFTAASGASIHYASFQKSDGTVLWNVAILDGSTSFTLPALSPDPLGTGARAMVITAADVPSFDPAHFAVPDVQSRLHRAAGASVDFTK
ncbi:MAG TPA: carboxypeptidase-like regulatory domain-containing protein [Kofleriaceae bacterium]|nr:carboxypeptidase-like regulatory domain-containing protein [Kofleriaceae bacterium]